MLSINKSDIVEVEYQIQAEGIAVSDISEIRLSIDNGIIYSFKGKLCDSKVIFRINPALFEVKNYNFCIEIITNYYFFKVLEDVISITEPDIKVKLISTVEEKIVENRIKPVVRLKL